MWDIVLLYPQLKKSGNHARIASRKKNAEIYIVKGSLNVDNYFYLLFKEKSRIPETDWG